MQWLQAEIGREPTKNSWKLSGSSEKPTEAAKSRLSSATNILWDAKGGGHKFQSRWVDPSFPYHRFELQPGKCPGVEVKGIQLLLLPPSDFRALAFLHVVNVSISHSPLTGVIKWDPHFLWPRWNAAFFQNEWSTIQFSIMSFDMI